MSDTPLEPLKLFYSYSHKDEKYREQLEVNLSVLRRTGIIKEWYDRKILAGDEWKERIDENLNSADIILLLASPDFIASDYCTDIEVKRALERHENREARVIPVILRKCAWKDMPFGKLQPLPKDDKPIKTWRDRDAAFLNVYEGIRAIAGEIRAVYSLTPATADPTRRPMISSYIPSALTTSFIPRQDSSGRNLLERLKEELAPGTSQVVALWGMGGVGKKTLAAEAARALSSDFQQRVVWINGDGREQFTLSHLLTEVVTQLGRADLRPLTLELKKQQVRDVVAELPTLLVLDSFEMIDPKEQDPCIEWFAQPGLGSVLITTRQKIEAAHNIEISGMTFSEAQLFLQALIARARNPGAFTNLDYEEIFRTAEGNPLVLRWIIAQIDLVQNPQAVLDSLRQGDNAPSRIVFDNSFNLPQLAPHGRVVLLALSLFVPNASRDALAEVVGLARSRDRKHLKEAIARLAALGLARVTQGDERLALEGLTRELAKARLAKDQRANTLRQRFIAYFLRYARAHERPTPEDFNMLEAEKENILSAMESAFEMKDWESVMRFYSALEEFLELRGYWNEAIRRSAQAIAAAKAANNELAAAQFAAKAAKINTRRGDFDAAQQTYQLVLDIFQKLESEPDIAATLHSMGAVAMKQNNLPEARRLYRDSLAIRKRLGNQEDIADTLHNLGVVAEDIVEAKKLYEESLEIRKQLGDQRGMAVTMMQLGSIAKKENRLKEARRLYEDSMVIRKNLGDRRGIALTLHNLALLAREEDNSAEAVRLLRESVRIFEDLKADEAEGAREALEQVEREMREASR